MLENVALVARWQQDNLSWTFRDQKSANTTQETTTIIRSGQYIDTSRDIT